MIADSPAHEIHPTHPRRPRVLVTGCYGFIGSVLVPMLTSRGYDVLGVDSDLYRDGNCGSGPAVVPRIGEDVRDVAEEDLRGMSAVLHLAALSNDPLGNLDAQLTMDINYRASVQLAEKAKRAGVRSFLFSSSCSCYGAAGDALLDEDAEFRPMTPYGESKVLADREISRLADENFSPTFLRNATAYGFSPRLRLDLVVNDFVAAAYLNKRIFIKSDGTPWRPLVHVEDICHAFLAILEAPRERVHDEAFNVGQTAENYRVSELADIVAEEVADCEIAYDPAGGPDKRCYRVRCDKLTRQVPTFEPQWNVRKGVQQLLAAYRQCRLSASDVQQQRFLRLPALERRRQEGAVADDLRPIQTDGHSTTNLDTSLQGPG